MGEEGWAGWGEEGGTKRYARSVRPPIMPAGVRQYLPRWVVRRIVQCSACVLWRRLVPTALRCPLRRSLCNAKVRRIGCNVVRRIGCNIGRPLQPRPLRR